jgi:glycosyltransferase involved in cell wall biosynthesis
MSKVLLVISATLAKVSQSGPRKDFVVLADRLGADVIDYESVEQSRSARLIKRVLGVAAAQAWLAFGRRNEADAILTDGEHIGIPLALMLKLTGARTPHVTIGHRITADKKRPFFRWLRVHSYISRIALHARTQFELGTRELGIEPAKLALVPYQVDTEFWRPRDEPEERMICSAGLEFRDYPTLMSAVDGLDAQVVIGAASHWSKRRNTAEEVGQPSNVTVDSFDYHALRSLYARSAIVVVPLDDTDFQAGVTTILEAMSMGKPVVVTHSAGQTDVVEDRRTVTRGANPRTRPASLLRAVAAQAGVTLEPTGFYVPPSDPQALRRAIAYLLEHPEERARLGAAGRRTVEQLTTVDQYATRLCELVDAAIAEAPKRRVAHRATPVAASAK